jgi:hypothetical protein
MNRQIIRWALALAFTGFGVTALQAQGDGGPLIDALVKKGVLSSQEGEEIRSEMLADYGSTPGGMLTYGSSAVKGLKLYGDARVRYQYDNNRPQGNLAATAAGNDRSRSRYRYRARLGADYLFTENWKAGIRLETEQSATSTNANFGSGFNKADDTVFFGLVYLQYETSSPQVFGLDVADYFDLRLGKHLHPFYINGVNGFWWDTDSNPEGFSQQIAWRKVAGEKLDFTLRGGQYLFSSNDSANTTSAQSELENDLWMFVAQFEANYEWASKSGVKIAPTLYAQTGGYISNGGAAIPAVSNATELQDLTMFILPAEVYFNVWERPLAIYGTFGINIADDRTAQIAGVNGGAVNGRTEQPIMWNAGVRYGQNRAKGQWQVIGEYRYAETGSANPYLMDSDFYEGLTNGHGPIVSASYSFTDNIVGTVTYFHALNIDQDLASNMRGAPGSAGTTPTSSQVLQVDLSWRF